MKKFLLVTLAALTICSTAFALGYNYTGTKEFKSVLETGKPVLIVDIQVPAEFAKHHFRGSLQTGAFPAKSDAEKEKLEKFLPVIAASNDDVVIVCPRGGGGAKNTYDYLRLRGIPEKRLHILEGGIENWPYPELTVRN